MCAQVREEALRSREALEHAAWREDRRDERSGPKALADEAHPVEELLERGLADGLAADARPILGLSGGVALEDRAAAPSVAGARAPRLGVVVRTGVVLDEIELVSLRERDRRLGQFRRTFVLVRVEVAPHAERDAIDRVAAECECHAFARVHTAANVVSATWSRSRASRTRGSVSTASSNGRSRAYADVSASSASASPGWPMSSR